MAITNPTPASTDDLITPDFAKTPGVGSYIYDLDYFTSSQCALYIGDVFVDEVVNISYSVQQSKTPIYGYASQLFDTVAPGQVIVQGQFTINFKEAGYLWLVLQRYKRFETTLDNTLNKLISPKLKNQFGSQSTLDVAKAQNGGGSTLLGGTNNPFARIKKNGKNDDFISRASIERLVSGAATKDERFQFYQSLAGYATVDNPNAQDTAFENIVEAFEDQVFQDNIKDIDQMTRRVDDNFFDNFDMFVLYGDYTKPGANHTVRRIRNAYLLSTGQQVGDNEGNILESYQFLARNIL